VSKTVTQSSPSSFIAAPMTQTPRLGPIGVSAPVSVFTATSRLPAAMSSVSPAKPNTALPGSVYMASRWRGAPSMVIPGLSAM
jgi:hypothetical protein